MNLRGFGRALRLDRVYEWLVGGPGAGRIRSQRIYRRAHALAMLGRGFGEGDWVGSGEAALLERIGRDRPRLRTLFDVGANIGGWSREAALVWPQAEIHAFEPASTTYAQLKAATEGLRVRAVNAALSDTSGEATLHAVPGQSGLTSLHDRDLAAHGMEMIATEKVPLMRLDDYAAEHGIDHIDFLKIDAEGHDLAVLRGATELIERDAVDLIQFEFGGANIDSRTFLRDFVRFLEPRYRISRILKDGTEPLIYGEHEEVFVTSNFLAERVGAVV